MLPLCVDLDGTVVRTDTLAESALSLLHRQPARALLFPLWLVRGRAYFKKRVAKEALLDVVHLPYNQDVLRFIARERSRGRHVVLATGADDHIARQVADYLGLFDEVYASDGVINLTGDRKAKLLVERFASGFSYVGDSSADVPVWKASREAIAAGPEALQHSCGNHSLSNAKRQRWRGLLNLLRVHQWVKNLLVFVPILAAHNWRDTAGMVCTLFGFVALCLCASAGYVANDLVDLQADRAHPRKRHRPLASGDVPLLWAAILLPVLAVLGLACAWRAGGGFLLFMLGYLVVTVIYSAWLKRVAILDVLVLAGLYALRIAAGGAAAQVILSPWLVGFSLFFFHSIALAKRCAELRTLQAPEDIASRRRGYSPADFDSLARFGTASACLSALVLALYIQAAGGGILYKRPAMLWGLVPLILFWTNWLWLQVSRGAMQEDPVLFALKDKASWVTLGLGALVFLLA